MPYSSQLCTKNIILSASLCYWNSMVFGIILPECSLSNWNKVHRVSEQPGKVKGARWTKGSNYLEIFQCNSSTLEDTAIYIHFLCFVFDWVKCWPGGVRQPTVLNRELALLCSTLRRERLADSSLGEVIVQHLLWDRFHARSTMNKNNDANTSQPFTLVQPHSGAHSGLLHLLDSQA